MKFGHSESPCRGRLQTAISCFGAVSGHARAVMIETAWLWIKHQPKSALTRWFVERTAGHSKRVRKIVIVAVARKLAIALWRYVELGLVPQGAIINSPMTRKARS